MTCLDIEISSPSKLAFLNKSLVPILLDVVEVEKHSDDHVHHSEDAKKVERNEVHSPAQVHVHKKT